MGTFNNVYIYARASSKGSQSYRQQNTLPAQIEDCTAWANEQGLSITKVFEERESGRVSNARRPVFKELMTYLKVNDLLIIACRDRLGRDAMNSLITSNEIITKMGADIYDLQTGTYFSEIYDDDGKYLNIILKDREAQNESKRMGERISRGLKVKKSNGEKWTHLPPLGSSWDATNHLVINEQETAMIDDIRRMRAEGLSFKAIALECQDKNYLNRAGKVPSQSSLSKICKGISIQVDRNLDGRVARSRLEDKSAGMQEYVKKFRSQGLSLRKIAIELNAMGYRTSKGGEIKHNQIARMIKKWGL
jgi:DNA invertase Pin-like site-specific DNA recombinase